MNAEDQHSVEATNPVLGTIKINNASLNTLVSIISFSLMCVISWVLYSHSSEAKDGAKLVANELKESNKDVATTLRETNKEITKVLGELAQAMREANCLAQFATAAEKAQNADLCKRLSR